MENKERIFNSLLLIKFYNKSYEKKFLLQCDKNLHKFSKYFSLILFLMSLIISIFNQLKKNNTEYLNRNEDVNMNIQMWIIYLVTAILFTNTILGFSLKKIRLLEKLITYFNYYSTIYIFMYLSFLVFVVSKTQPMYIVYLTIVIEFILRLIFIFLSLLDFVESFILNVLIVFSVWIVNYLIGFVKVSYQILIMHTVYVFFNSFYTYFYTMQIKKTFYFHLKEIEKYKRNQTVMDNMNTGFIIVKKRSIEYVNKPIVDLVFKDEKFLSLINVEKVNKKIPKNFNDKIKIQEKIYKTSNNLFEEKKNEKFNKKDNDINYFITDEGDLILRNDFNLNITKNISYKNPEKEKLSTNQDEKNSSSIDQKEKNYLLKKEIIKKKSSEILKELFKGLELNESIFSKLKEKLRSDFSNMEESFSTEDMLNMLKNEVLTDGQFIFLGIKEIKFHNPLSYNENSLNNNFLNRNESQNNENQKDESTYYEINVRYTKNLFDDNFEIILNDISRIKYTENKNSEFKYKTIFLSKVAHEFKNPLICIIELIDQFYDIKLKLNNTFHTSKINEILNQIKGISNYLLILVKDLDYFSISQAKINFKLENNNCNLQEIINFIKEIGYILLKKAKKLDIINFNVEKNLDVKNFIYTDEIKLKQILVNLLSNSIKFTNKGEINLEIKNSSDKENEINFIFKDTGIGMLKEKNNFSLFKKSLDKSNNLGTGLGLFIISELTTLLGTQIKIFSELGKGSVFTFGIKDNFPFVDKNYNYKKIKINLPPIKKNFFERSKTWTKIKYSSFNNFESDIFIGMNLKPINEKKISASHSNSFEMLRNFKLSKKTQNTYKINENLLNLKLINNSERNILYKKYSSIENESLASSNSLSDLESLEKIIFKPNFERNIKKNLNIEIINDDHFIKPNNLEKKPKEKEILNVIICDDEDLTRSASMRVIKKYFDTNIINTKYVLNLIETRDGLEIFEKYYNFLTKGKEIFCIISDESMNYLNGSETSVILKNIVEKNNLKKIPFYLVTAYPKENFMKLLNDSLDNFFNKPIKIQEVNEIFKSLINNEKNFKNVEKTKNILINFQ